MLSAVKRRSSPTGLPRLGAGCCEAGTPLWAGVEGSAPGSAAGDGPSAGWPTSGPTASAGEAGSAG
eukprot:94312-Alexandrium_andersonii.AAC.1